MANLLDDIRRAVLEWEWYSDVNAKAVMLHFLLCVKTKPTRFKGMLIEEGSLLCSRKAASEEIGISEQSFRTALAKLIKCGEVKKQSTNKITIITLCKYDSYKRFFSIINQQPTSKQPTSNQQTNQQPTNKKPYINDCVINSYEEKNFIINQQPTNKSTNQLTNKPTKKEENDEENDEEKKKRKVAKEIKEKEEEKEEEKKESSSSSFYAREENFDNNQFKKFKGEPLKKTGESHPENGLAARAKIEVSMPNYIRRDEIGNWLVTETSTEWKESICREFGCKMSDLPWLFSQYVDELTKQGVDDKDERDIRKHFLSMMRVKSKMARAERIDPYKTNPNGISPEVDKLLTKLFGE